MPLTARQQTILAWLGRAYPSAADLFTSGLRVREDTELPCRIRLMAHAFRELCIVINNQHSSNSRDFEPLLYAMEKEYRSLNYEPTPLAPPLEAASQVPKDGSVAVPGAFMLSVAKVVESRGSRLSGRERARIALQAMSGASGRQADVTPTATRWHDMYSYFVGRAHAHDADSGGTDPTALDHELQFFEETLESFAQPAITNLDELDVILESANS